MSEPSIDLLGVPLTPTDYEGAIARILDWIEKGEPGFVCAANVHMIMEAQDRPDLMKALQLARMVTPDGMPLVWRMRRQGAPDQTRVYGPELMWRLCEQAQQLSLRIGLYGGRLEVLNRLVSNLRMRFPELQIAYHYSPPFHALGDAEDARVVEQIASAHCDVLFVGLGCPKQELWMADHRDRVGALMLGVGAAFDFHAGVLPQAPPFLQQAGMEWLFRLSMEPRRLWRRYLKNNPRFIWLIISEYAAKAGYR